jgi:aspartate carbamoyltransferase
MEDQRVTTLVDQEMQEALQSLTGQHVISVEQFSSAMLEGLFAEAKHMEHLVDRRVALSSLRGLVVASLFYEPSTRTDMSFQAAVQRLGGRTIMTGGGVTFSSVTKGESLHDTIKTIACYADAVVLRHPVKGSARQAADASDQLKLQMRRTVPIINAGDGTGEHPTQALLDLYTIKDRFGRNIDGLTIGVVGDLRNGRTVHSLLKLLAIDNCRVNVICIAPEGLTMPQEYVQFARSRDITIRETDDLLAAMPELDVLYVTRVQRERFVNQELENLAHRAYGRRFELLDPPLQEALRPVAELQAVQEYEKAREAYVIDPTVLGQAKRDMILLHPLPRLTEIPPEVDLDPRAAYFRQMQNGLYIRMALMAAVMGRLE